MTVDVRDLSKGDRVLVDGDRPARVVEVIVRRRQVVVGTLDNRVWTVSAKRLTLDDPRSSGVPSCP